MSVVMQGCLETLAARSPCGTTPSTRAASAKAECDKATQQLPIMWRRRLKSEIWAEGLLPVVKLHSIQMKSLMLASIEDWNTRLTMAAMIATEP